MRVLSKDAAEAEYALRHSIGDLLPVTRLVVWILRGGPKYKVHQKTLAPALCSAQSPAPTFVSVIDRGIEVAEFATPNIALVPSTEHSESALAAPGLEASSSSKILTTEPEDEGADELFPELPLTFDEQEQQAKGEDCMMLAGGRPIYEVSS